MRAWYPQCFVNFLFHAFIVIVIFNLIVSQTEDNTISQIQSVCLVRSKVFVCFGNLCNYDSTELDVSFLIGLCLNIVNHPIFSSVTICLISIIITSIFWKTQPSSVPAIFNSSMFPDCFSSMTDHSTNFPRIFYGFHCFSNLTSFSSLCR